MQVSAPRFIRLCSAIFGLVPPTERVALRRVIFLLFCMAALDAMGVASVMPFIGVVANQELIRSEPILIWIFSAGGFETEKSFTLFLGISVLLFLLFSLSLKAFAIYSQVTFSMRQEAVLAKKLFEVYVTQDYQWLVRKNSSELEQIIFTEVQQFIFQGLAPLLLTLAQTMVCLSVFSVLLIVDFKLAISIFMIFVIGYAFLFWSVKGRIDNIGKERFTANKNRFRVATEAFGSAKIVKILGLEGFFYRSFSTPAEIHATKQAQGQVLSQLPRFALEGVAFTALVIAILYLNSTRGGIAEIIPVLTLFAMAGYRMMPAFQQIYTGVSNLRLAGPAIEKIQTDLRLPNGNLGSISDGDMRDIFLSDIAFSNVVFTYDGGNDVVIDNMSFSIAKGSHVAFVGATGSGKTTIIDLICGLLRANHGAVLIDGFPVDDSNERVWRQQIGYVTQSTFLIDDTIAANVAFGVDPSAVDINRVLVCLRAAQLHEFAVDNECGVRALVGERGERLSGGQVQRVGIARALYRQPAVLVLDEATSALDSTTERKVLSSISEISGSLTIISIAHRISTIENCESIFVIERGKLINFGTASELRAISPVFRSLAETTD